MAKQIDSIYLRLLNELSLMDNLTDYLESWDWYLLWTVTVMLRSRYKRTKESSLDLKAQSIRYNVIVMSQSSVLWE